MKQVNPNETYSYQRNIENPFCKTLISSSWAWWCRVPACNPNSWETPVGVWDTYTARPDLNKQTNIKLPLTTGNFPLPKVMKKLEAKIKCQRTCREPGECAETTSI